jgi:hypothetical protein
MVLQEPWDLLHVPLESHGAGQPLNAQKRASKVACAALWSSLLPFELPCAPNKAAVHNPEDWFFTTPLDALLSSISCLSIRIFEWLRAQQTAHRQVPRRQTVSHRPVPSDRHVGGMRAQGNGNLSAHRAAAVRRIVMHAMMAAVVVAHAVSGPSDTLRAAVQSPRQFENSVPDHASFDVCWDTGASLTVTPDKRDFIDQVRRPSIAVRLKGTAAPQ